MNNTNILISLSSFIKKLFELITFIQIIFYFISMKSKYNYAINFNLSHYCVFFKLIIYSNTKIDDQPQTHDLLCHNYGSIPQRLV
jgi:hypothetical protein